MQLQFALITLILVAPNKRLCPFHLSIPFSCYSWRTDGSQDESWPFLPAVLTMMPSKSTPNLQQSTRETKPNASSLYSYYLQNQSGHNFACAPSSRDDGSPPPAPPVRDSSSLKSVKYGPGHEKFPSWPVPAAAEAPQVLRGPTSGGSHRSKSWTDHTNYPKEKVVTYTRPYMKKQHSSHTQQVSDDAFILWAGDRRRLRKFANIRNE